MATSPPLYIILLRAIGPVTHKLMSMAQWREADSEGFDVALEILEQASNAWRLRLVPFWAVLPVEDPFGA